MSQRWEGWVITVEIMTTSVHVYVVWPDGGSNPPPVNWQTVTLTKASFTLSRCTPLCAPAVCSRQIGANREGTLVRSYIPSSDKDQTRYIPSVAPSIGDRAPLSLRRVTEVGRQSPGVTR